MMPYVLDDPVDSLFTLRNAQDMRVDISDRGAALVAWFAPDRDGHFADVLLGHPRMTDYVENPHFFGAAVGRWANRIRGGRFTLDGQLRQLACNDRGNHLHGAEHGFHRASWQVDVPTGTASSVTMRHVSPAGEGGYPGTLQVQVCYTLLDDGSLSIRFDAQTDAATPVNLTSHPYFNLNGGVCDIGAHRLQIHADRYLQIDQSGAPTGMADVTGSPFDFREPAAIGARLAQADPQLLLGNGFDHFFCNRLPGQAVRGVLRELARVSDPLSGRCLQVLSSEDGVQFYSGNALAGVPGKSEQPYRAHDGFCLEAHACPDQINGAFANEVVLRPGASYSQTTIYRMTLQD